MTLFKDKFKIDSKRLKNWDYSSEAIYFITLVTRNRECIFGSILEDKMILNENGQIVENELLKSIKIRKNWFFHNWIVMPNHIHLLIEIQEPRLDRQIENTKVIDAKNKHSHIVEAHSSASPPSISTTNINDVVQIIDTKNEHSHIVEAHSSASPSSISTTNINTNISRIVDESGISITNINANVQIFGETHCCAPLRDNWDGNMRYNSNQNLGQNENQFESQLSRKSNSISSFVGLFKSVTTRQINGSVSIWQTNYHDHIVRNYKRFETIYNYIKANPRSWETDSINSNFQ